VEFSKSEASSLHPKLFALSVVLWPQYHQNNCYLMQKEIMAKQFVDDCLKIRHVDIGNVSAELVVAIFEAIDEYRYLGVEILETFFKRPAKKNVEEISKIMSILRLIVHYRYTELNVKLFLIFKDVWMGMYSYYPYLVSSHTMSTLLSCSFSTNLDELMKIAHICKHSSHLMQICLKIFDCAMFDVSQNLESSILPGKDVKFANVAYRTLMTQKLLAFTHTVYVAQGKETEIFQCIFHYIHQIFIESVDVMKAVHMQGYPESILPIFASTVDSMRDFF
jgi:hypothetical protein